MNWTAEQQYAIDLKHKNILVSAAAGSGKTALLTERLIRLVLDEKIDVSRLLVVTFTRAASREMKERFKGRLYQALNEEQDEKTKKFLRDQVQLLDEAQFSTMDAFSIGIVRNYFHLTDIEPGFRIGDSAELKLMLQEASEEIFEEYLELGACQKLFDLFTDIHSQQRLRDIVFLLLSFLETVADEEAYLQESVARLREAGFEDPLYQRFYHYLIELSQDAKRRIQNLIAIWKNETGDKKAAGFLESDLNYYQRLASSQDLPAYLHTLGEKYARASYPKKSPLDPDVKNQISTTRDALKKQFQELAPLQKTLDYEIESNRRMADILEQLITLSLSVRGRFEEKKKEKNLVDFAQIAKATLKILKDDQAREEISEHYDYLFFDEYQDTNEIQEKIMASLARPASRFMVGDLKQSIYRFRKADPEIFIEKYQRYQDQEDAEVVLLNRNFRSSAEVIDGINTLFEKIMSPTLGDLTYDDSAKLIPGREVIGGSMCELDILHADETREDSTVHQETEHIAKRIHQLLDENPNLKLSDIAILHRSANTVSEEMSKCLSQYGIAVISESEYEFFDSLEVRMALDLLSLIDNLHQDLALSSILLSPIGQFTLEEVSQIRAARQDLSFSKSMLEYEKQGLDPYLKKKMMIFLEKIREYREFSLLMPMDEFIWQILLKSGYYSYVGGLEGGKLRQRNLRILVERASQYEKSTYKGISHFLQYIEKLKKRDQKLNGSEGQGSLEDAVHLMSIHKSKGLEFPVVILCGTGRHFKNRDTQTYSFHKRYGVGGKDYYMGDYLPGKRPTLREEAILQVQKQETLSEEMRLLYVAMTRAEKKLIVTGITKDEKIFDHAGDFETVALQKAGCFLEWLVMALVREQENILPGQILYSDPFWLVRYGSAGEAEIPNMKKLNDPLPDHLTEALAHQINLPPVEKRPARLSVSAIKAEKHTHEFVPLKKPELTALSALSEQEDSHPAGAEYGTLVHHFIEILDLEPFSQLQSEDYSNEIFRQQKELIERKLFSEDEAEKLDTGLILGFLNSQLGQRLLQSVRENPESTVREFPFILQNHGEDEIQGIIDCFFVEGENIILIDFKTDRFHRLPDYLVQERLQSYQLQLNLYAQALEKLTGMKVYEKHLYLLSEGNDLILKN